MSEDSRAEGRRLREVRRWAGMTQAQAGRHCDLSDKQISKYERGESVLTVATLARLANGFGCPAMTLLKPPGTLLPARSRKRLRRVTGGQAVREGIDGL